MRQTILVSLLASLVAGGAFGQALVEHAAAAAGGSVGGVAGKKVSDGVSNIFNKVNQTTTKAAAASKTAPLLEVSPGVPGAAPPAASAKVAKPSTAESVPPPPPSKRAAVVVAAPRPPAPAPAPVRAVAAPRPVEPPRPVPTLDQLHEVSLGTRRAELLQLGAPASRIMMVDGGHMAEIYRYMIKDDVLGVIRLSDGVVSDIQLR